MTVHSRSRSACHFGLVAFLSGASLLVACAPASSKPNAASSAGTPANVQGGSGSGSAGTTTVASGQGAPSSGAAGAAGGTSSAGSGSMTVAMSGSSSGTDVSAGDTEIDGGAVQDAAGEGLATSDANTYADWVLSWSDEFNAAAGTPPDPKYWSYDLGGGGWGVNQLQTYTNSTANAATDGLGNLAIVAIKDAQGNFTSARIKTQTKFQQAYGRFEIRAKVVTGNGMWPAFWMLGDNFDTAGWPQCGEIDIMEVRGTQPYKNGGSLHGPGYSGMHPLSGSFSLPEGGPLLSDDFHIYAIEWETGVVHFFVDDNLYETHTPADVPADAGPWVYDHPFFILINVAVGGTYPGPPDGTVFPQTMLVDYVRAYQRPDAGM